MRFLVDSALSSTIAKRLSEIGHDAVHVIDYGMEASPDGPILDQAAAEDRVLISADTDFGEILALRSETKPSLLLLRLPNWKPARQLALIEAILPEVELNLNEGAVVVLELARIRIRPLPIVH